MAKLLRVNVSDEFVDRWYEESGNIYRERFDRDRPAILALNAQVRANPEMLKRQDGMRWALSIPQDDFPWLLQKFPELGSSDREIKHRAYQAFMQHPFSEPYRMYTPSKRGATA